ncbi:MAG: hypothetical protein JNK05_01500 [Myxococcales bacterium]|nr:hypothetical protein [Myxococcales bacterium]
MEPTPLRELLRALEPTLATAPFERLVRYERNGRGLNVCVTDRLRRAAVKEGVWRSHAMVTALENGRYGFDPDRARSLGGRDGLFVVDRDFRPANAMMKKLYDRYLDKPESGAELVASALGCAVSELVAVRLVSHHLRLLGVLSRGADDDWLVLVDVDR